MQCPQHGVEFILKPAGVSKKTGQPYQAFYACPEFGCKERPPRQGGWGAVRQQVAEKVAPEKAVMTKEDWEAKEARTNKNILLQVAFKAAVKLICHGKTQPGQTVFAITQEFHDWLLTHTEGQTKPISQNTAPQQTLGTMVGYQEGYTPPQEGENIPLPQEPW